MSEGINTAPTLKEPSWHRRLRSARAKARLLLRTEAATSILLKHHGSTPPAMGFGRGRDHHQQYVQVPGKSKGKGYNHAAPSPTPPWRDATAAAAAAAVAAAAAEAAAAAATWTCPTCKYRHPQWKNHCGLWCSSHPKHIRDAAAVSTAGTKQGRWRKPSQPNQQWQTNSANQPPQWQQHQQQSSNDSMDFDIATPLGAQKPDNLEEVMAWFSEKGAGSDIIDKLNSIKCEHENDTESVSDEEPIDPWRQLQSSKDKLTNIERDLQALDIKLFDAQRIADDLQEKRDALQVRKQAEVDMIDKMKKIALDSKESLGSSQLVHKINQYEDLIGQIQQMVSAGLPSAEHTSERHELYNLIFFGQKVRPADKQQQEAPPPATQNVEGDLSSEVVDRSGFGFGPVKGARPEPTPYAAGKGPTSSADNGGELSAPETSKA